MPSARLLKRIAIDRTIRVRQVEGMFDLPASKESARTWEVDLPIEGFDWKIGLIVGSSGSGKTSIAREIFGKAVDRPLTWSARKSIVDDFGETLSIKEITKFLSSVGLSSPPSWLRPFHALSNGEQFRVGLARRLAEASPGETVVVDEFTSVGDRTVAKIGSAAVAKAIRSSESRFVAVACHDDIVEWLCPDWVYWTDTGTFERRLLRRRPAIRIEIRRGSSKDWVRFAHHHYLSHAIHRASMVFVAYVEGRPAALTAVGHFPHPRKPAWREHRSVCLPDYQGVGIGNALADFVAGVMVSTGKRYRSTTSHPAMIASRKRSANWKLVKKPSLNNRPMRGVPNWKQANRRLTAAFEYVGPARAKEAAYLGIGVTSKVSAKAVAMLRRQV